MSYTSGLVAVFGATGFTGRLVLDGLRQRGLAAIAIGRSASRLAAAQTIWHGHADAPPLETRQADATRPEEVRAALTGADLVISCAGPFTELGRPCVDAAVELGIPYLDSTGEQPFVMDCHQRLDGAARDSGSAVVNAMAYEVAPADLAASIAAEGLTDIQDVVVAYDMESSATSRGTRLSILRIAQYGGWRWQGGRFVRDLPGRTRGLITFPRGRRRCASIPGAENLTVPRHVQTERCTTFLSMPASQVLGLAVGRKALPWLLGTGVGDAIRRRAGSGPSGPSERERSKGFTILVEAYSADRFRRVTVRGRDPYGLTGAVLAEAARRLLTSDGVSDATGVLAPAQKFEPRPFLAALAGTLSHVPEGRADAARPSGPRDSWLRWELEEGTL